MSRRAPNPGAERAAQNQATIKSLLKLEPNKVCADCKRNKHPRWASWNLGIFICIRCSGIHRGMGTHISRVKSVDLDSWTDEQLQSVLNWGNARANKYWEAKLAPGHTPSESKIENFIRTKYELKRWTMDGPIPDPATLDAPDDDDVPLSLVKEKQPSAPVSSSVFNLSPPQSKPAAPAAPAPAPSSTAAVIGGANLSGADVWGGNEWSTSSQSTAAQKSPSLPKPASTTLGWEGGSFANTPIVPGSNGGFSLAPKVAADEEFGGWASSTGPATSSGTAAKGGFGADDDLFSNVWQ
ncbi:ArfGap-domain-containing protein [Trichoderma longibrachiatum ATCC 18648]|uniref:ArfGap-domain-containing protein n=1 Tax=Trichoderma longibrachiatum ATCC 18648 TaxID=983965 RepID=A0A2T4C3V4_TRILO|nr:ArfGap-domain-containing protein [Trichoderma longibrachiatum ATCC 18648]